METYYILAIIIYIILIALCIAYIYIMYINNDSREKIDKTFHDIKNIKTTFSKNDEEISNKIEILSNNIINIQKELEQELKNNDYISSNIKLSNKKILDLDIKYNNIDFSLKNIMKQYNLIQKDIANFKLLNNNKNLSNNNLSKKNTDDINILYKKINVLYTNNDKKLIDIQEIKKNIEDIQNYNKIQLDETNVYKKNIEDRNVIIQASLTQLKNDYNKLVYLESSNESLNTNFNTFKISTTNILNNLEKDYNTLSSDLNIIKLLTTDNVIKNISSNIDGMSSIINILSSKNDNIVKDVIDIQTYINTLKNTPVLSVAQFNQLGDQITTLSTKNTFFTNSINTLSTNIDTLLNEMRTNFNNLEGSLNNFFVFKDGIDTNLPPNKKMYERIFGGTNPELNIPSKVISYGGMKVKTSSELINDKNIKFCNDTNSCLNFNTNTDSFNMTPENLNNFKINSKSKTIITNINMDNGNVGIGTLNPQYKLDVIGDINCSGNFKINGTALNNLSKWDSSGNSLYYNKGNVGIGAAINPQNKLQIEHSSTDSGANNIALYVYNPLNVANNNSCITNRIAGTSANKAIYSLDVAGSYGWSIYTQGNDANKSLKFNNNWAGTGNNILVLQQSGNIFLNGLRINGADKANTIYQETGSLGITGNTTSGITFNLLGTTGGAGECMRINNNGNIGIGTNNPQHKLDVDGNIRSSGVLYQSWKDAIIINGGINGKKYRGILLNQFWNKQPCYILLHFISEGGANIWAGRLYINPGYPPTVNTYPDKYVTVNNNSFAINWDSNGGQWFHLLEPLLSSGAISSTKCYYTATIM